jgi:hypothetical protein
MTIHRTLAVVALTVLAFNCAVVVAPDKEPIADSEQPITITPDAVLYNTPGPQSNDAGVLGTQTNPFALIVSQKYADATHRGAWAVDSESHYGTFVQPVTLSGILQYKWIQCGAPGAGC